MPVGRSAGYLPTIGAGFEALEARAWRNSLDGFAVVNGLKVTTDGTDLTLDVGQSAGGGTATVGESSGTVQTVSLGSAGTVTLDAADSTNPRKDTIYIDTNGDLQAETGTAESALPSGNDRFTTFQPESPLPSTEGTVLARVWVGAGVTSIQSADIDDLRVPADTVADDVTARSVSADELIIGGTLYEEDDNSPINVSSTSSTTYTLANSADEIIVLHEAGVGVHDELQVNGDTGTNYANTTTADSETTGEDHWSISRLRKRDYIKIADKDGGLGFRAPLINSETGRVIRGENENVSPPVTQFTISDSSFSSDIRARVYRRVMNI